MRADAYVPRVYYVPDNRYPVYGRQPVYPIALRVMTLRECAGSGRHGHADAGTDPSPTTHGDNYRWVNEWRADLAHDARLASRTPYVLICLDERATKATDRVVIRHVRYHSEALARVEAVALASQYHTPVDLYGYVGGRQVKLITIPYEG